MTVRRRKDRGGRWYYEFESGGGRFQGACLTPDGQPARTKAQAEAAESLVKVQAKADHHAARNAIRPGTYSLAMALDRHIGKCETDGVSASHIASLNRIAGEMLAHFTPARAASDINADDVEGYRKFLVAQKRKVWIGGPRKQTVADLDNPKLWKTLDRPRSPSEVNHCLDLLRCALNAVHGMRDPRTGLSMLPWVPAIEPVFDPARDPTPMSEVEFRARLEGAPSWVVEAASLAWWFGLRLGEVLTLELRHLDFENRCLRLLGAETKKGKDQAVWGGDRGWILARWLARQARRRGQSRLVTWPGPAWFRAQRRGEAAPPDAWRPLTTIKRSWGDTIGRAGIDQPRRFHDLRAAYITNVARLGSSTVTKGLARHESMATTERYIKLADRELSDAADLAASRRRRPTLVRR